MNCKKSVADIFSMKGKNKIICLTSYTYPVASIADKHCDLILVGDSLGSTIYGMNSTVGVTLDMMIAHGKAVSNACKNACLVVDMPFATYNSPEKAFENAAKIITETKCDAVKLEGGRLISDTVRHLVDNGIPVMGHVGLMPQHIKVLGKYKYYGKNEDSRKITLDDAVALAEAGAFSVVLECVTEVSASEITKKVHIPTIGIGSSGACDGQILVIDDMIGLSDAKMKFIKKFANTAETIETAVQDYSVAVKESKFPGEGMYIKE